MPKDSKAKQSYRTAWESLPDFKGWLQAVPGNPSRAYCAVCNRTLYAHRLTLLQHMCTAKHTKQAQMKFNESEERKSNEGQHNTTTSTTELMALDVDSAAIDLNTFESPDINSSEDEAPNLYINSVTKPVPQGSQHQCANTAPPISTHVLDSSRGTPVASLHVSLYKLIDGGWTLISECVTNPVGRCSEFISREDFKPGRFKLHFDVDRYFELRKQDYFYPFIEDYLKGCRLLCKPEEDWKSEEATAGAAQGSIPGSGLGNVSYYFTAKFPMKFT